MAEKQQEADGTAADRPPTPPGLSTTGGMLSACGDPAPIENQAAVAEAGSVPPGLDYLLHLDQLLIHQQVELVEAFTGWESNNKYAIKNLTGQQCYFALEQTTCCARSICASERGFLIKILDNTQRECVVVRRRCNPCATKACWCACFGCCQHKITVEAPPGNEIGHINNSCGFLWDKFQVFLGDTEIAYINGPCCTVKTCCKFCNVNFKIYSELTGDVIGKISKHYGGIIQEAYTDADNFAIEFPKDLEVKAKAILLSAVFLIDFLYFEKSGRFKAPPTKLG